MEAKLNRALSNKEKIYIFYVCITSSRDSKIHLETSYYKHNIQTNNTIFIVAILYYNKCWNVGVLNLTE